MVAFFISEKWRYSHPAEFSPPQVQPPQRIKTATEQPPVKEYKKEKGGF
ncbi:hypothetical protein [Pasteurella sp. PK-2025]